MKKLALSLGLILCSGAAFADCPAGTVCETGHFAFDSAGPLCYKGHIMESGNLYAVIYGSAPSDLAGMGWVTALHDGALVSVLTNSTQPSPIPQCDNGQFLQVIGVRNGNNPNQQ
jgi:hypothetical protein